MPPKTVNTLLCFVAPSSAWRLRDAEDDWTAAAKPRSNGASQWWAIYNLWKHFMASRHVMPPTPLLWNCKYATGASRFKSYYKPVASMHRHPSGAVVTSYVRCINASKQGGDDVISLSNIERTVVFMYALQYVCDCSRCAMYTTVFTSQPEYNPYTHVLWYYECMYEYRWRVLWSCIAGMVNSGRGVMCRWDSVDSPFRDISSISRKADCWP